MTTSPPPMPPTPVLETRRLILRPLRQEDAPAIQRRFPRWEVVRYLASPGALALSGRRRGEPCRAQCLAEMSRGESAHWTIYLKERPGRADRRHQPVARQRREPRPARLLAGPEFQGRGLDDRGGRAGDRISPSSNSAGRISGSAMPRPTARPAGSRRSRAHGWSTANPPVTSPATAGEWSGCSPARIGWRGATPETRHRWGVPLQWRVMIFRTASDSLDHIPSK